MSGPPTGREESVIDRTWRADGASLRSVRLRCSPPLRADHHLLGSRKATNPDRRGRGSLRKQRPVAALCNRAQVLRLLKGKRSPADHGTLTRPEGQDGPRSASEFSPGSGQTEAPYTSQGAKTFVERLTGSHVTP